MQCKDIPTKPILEFLLAHEGIWCNHWDYDPTVLRAMPDNLPEKLPLAKMRQLLKSGLVDGCGCGCRGDWRITAKGKEWLRNLNETPQC